ncbi:MAG: sulfite exporter TauE/SafE family protein [Pseudomonadota bacterium]
MTAEAIHAGIGWYAAGALVALSFATSFIAAAFGLGGGAIMLAVLATLLPAAAILPVHGLVQLGSNAGRAAIMLPHFERAVLLPFVVGAAIGVALGGALFVQLPGPAIQVAVGLFVLWSLVGRPPAALNRSAGIAGAFSSFLTMFFGATGVFVAAFVRTLKLDREAHVATHSVLMTIQHTLKTIAFGLFGFAFAAWAPLIAALVASGFVGTLAGRAVLSRLSDDRFRKVLDAVLLILGLNLVVSGLQSAFGVSILPAIGGSGG